MEEFRYEASDEEAVYRAVLASGEIPCGERLLEQYGVQVRAVSSAASAREAFQIHARM